MANPEHLAILAQGREVWNTWRDQSRRNPWNKTEVHEPPDLTRASLAGVDLRNVQLDRCDLTGADLREANLRRADLRWANLRAALLSRAILSSANLRRANLSGADLTGARLSRSDMAWANISTAALRDADLRSVSLNSAKLMGTDFTRAWANGTQFDSVDLSVAKGLEDIRHRGPSTIGIDTIYKSNGNIPEVFLRGCGVPDDMIGYIKSIAGAIQFYSCFISYSTKDQEFAERLYNDLQGNGVRCWFAPHDIRGGRKLHEQLDEAIRVHDKLLLILSDDSMASEWVKTEIRKARQREIKEGKRILFPIRLVSFEALRDWVCLDFDGRNLAEEIREYFIPDFSNWKDHDSYQAAFQRLVKDLKAEARSAAG